MQDVWQTAHCKNWMPILQITTLPKIQVKLSLVFSWNDDWIFGKIGEYRGYFIKNTVCCVLWPAFMCCTHPENSVQFKRFLSLILISKTFTEKHARSSFFFSLCWSSLGGHLFFDHLLWSIFQSTGTDYNSLRASECSFRVLLQLRVLWLVVATPLFLLYFSYAQGLGFYHINQMPERQPKLYSNSRW